MKRILTTMSMDILRPSYLTDFESLKILVVCESEKGEKAGEELGEALIDIQRPFGVTVFVKKCLPLSKQCQKVGEHFDFIIFMTDLRSKQSFPSIKKSLKFVHIEYFLGKCCFVVHPESSNNQTAEVECMEKWYRTPMLSINFSDKNKIQEAAAKLMIMAENSCGWTEEFLKL